MAEKKPMSRREFIRTATLLGATAAGATVIAPFIPGIAHAAPAAKPTGPEGLTAADILARVNKRVDYARSLSMSEYNYTAKSAGIDSRTPQEAVRMADERRVGVLSAPETENAHTIETYPIGTEVVVKDEKAEVKTVMTDNGVVFYSADGNTLHFLNSNGEATHSLWGKYTDADVKYNPETGLLAIAAIEEKMVDDKAQTSLWYIDAKFNGGMSGIQVANFGDRMSNPQVVLADVEGHKVPVVSATVTYFDELDQPAFEMGYWGVQQPKKPNQFMAPFGFAPVPTMEHASEPQLVSAEGRLMYSANEHVVSAEGTYDKYWGILVPGDVEKVNVNGTDYHQIKPPLGRSMSLLLDADGSNAAVKVQDLALLPDHIAQPAAEREVQEETRIRQTAAVYTKNGQQPTLVTLAEVDGSMWGVWQDVPGDRNTKLSIAANSGSQIFEVSKTDMTKEDLSDPQENQTVVDRREVKTFQWMENTGSDQRIDGGMVLDVCTRPDGKGGFYDTVTHKLVNADGTVTTKIETQPAKFGMTHIWNPVIFNGAALK